MSFALLCFVIGLIWMSQCQWNNPDGCGLTYWGRDKLDCRHFEDDILKGTFFNENVWISLRISLKFELTILHHRFIGRQPGHKPLSEPTMTLICVTRPRWVKTELNQHNNGWTCAQFLDLAVYIYPFVAEKFLSKKELSAQNSTTVTVYW